MWPQPWKTKKPEAMHRKSGDTVKRVFLIVLDSFGIGQMPDAEAFSDRNVNTLRSCQASGELNIPNMV